MTNLPIPDSIAEEIRLEAEAEGIPVEEVILAAWRHYRRLAQTKKIEAEMAWWENQPAEVKAQYADQQIAVHNKEVVDHDIDAVALHGRIRKRYGRTAVLLVPAEGPREFRVVNVRMERA
jgi:hypothetical protein